MNDESMTKEQLLHELNALRKEVDRFRKAEAERERYVKELKERARFLTGVLEASPIVFTITRRKDGRFLLVNPAHGRESGYSPEEVLGKTSLKLNMYVNKADRDAFVKILEETGELNNFEVQYRNKDGSVRDVLLYARPLVYAGEECMLTASLPITERKRAEQKITKYRDHLGELVKERTAQLESEITVRKRAEAALRESEEKYRSMMEAMDQAVYICSQDYLVEYMNPAMVKRTGRDAIGELCYKVINGLDEKCPWCLHNKVQSSESFETEIVSPKDGRSYNISHSPIFHEDGSISKMTIFRDITGRKEADEALRESEEKYRTILESIEESYFEVDITGNFTFFNDALSKSLGYSNDELLGMNNRDYMSPETSKKIYNLFNQIYRTGNPIKKAIYEIIRKDGSRGFHEMFASLMKNQTGQPIGFRGIAHDITEFKKAEDALRESKENLDKAQKMAHIGNWSRDLNLNRAQWSDEIYRNLGLTPGDPAEPSFETFLSRVHPEDRERVSLVLKEAAEKKQAFEFEFRTIPIESSERIIQNRGEVEYDETGTPVRLFGTNQDITETRKLQARVQESQKIEAIVTLAGGIAHNFNNALTPIIGNVDLLQMEHSQDEKTMECLKDMKTSGLRMAHLTSQLLAYAEGGKYNPQVLSLSDFVEDTLPLIQHTLDPSVRVETDLPLDVKDMEADSTQIQMVLSAIMANSNEAMEGPGRIRISTRNMDIDQELIKDHSGLKSGPHVCLSIEDDGKGMDEETRRRIFDPFFTTYFMGCGLGMASLALDGITEK